MAFDSPDLLLLPVPVIGSGKNSQLPALLQDREKDRPVPILSSFSGWGRKPVGLFSVMPDLEHSWEKAIWDSLLGPQRNIASANFYTYRDF